MLPQLKFALLDESNVEAQVITKDSTEFGVGLALSPLNSISMSMSLSVRL